MKFKKGDLAKFIESEEVDPTLHGKIVTIIKGEHKDKYSVYPSVGIRFKRKLDMYPMEGDCQVRLLEPVYKTKTKYLKEYIKKLK